MTVFLCHVPSTQLRERMFHLCLERWSNTPLRVRVLACETRHAWLFQKERRCIADDLASGPYILADDDCFFGRLDLEGIVRTCDRHEDFDILSMIPLNCTIVPWQGGYMGTEVMEHVSVGGIRFCRKGLPFPPLSGPGYDMAQCEAIRKSGKKVGYLRNHPMIHLGEGFSTVW